MSDEYFDILDASGNKTGEIISRDNAHSRGAWHRTVHVWILNQNGDVLLQRRSADKDFFPNMLDISSAGHLLAGEDSLSGAVREIKEELGIDVKPEELRFIKTSKNSFNYKPGFMENQFEDLYILRTSLDAASIEIQKEELQDAFYVPYKEFKNMVAERHPELRMHDEEFEILFAMFDKEFG